MQNLRGDPSASDAGVMDALEQTLHPRTRLVVLSHLLWNTGQIMPITAVADRLSNHRIGLPAGGCRPGRPDPHRSAAAAADIYGYRHKWACGRRIRRSQLFERLLRRPIQPDRLAQSPQ